MRTILAVMLLLAATPAMAQPPQGQPPQGQPQLAQPQQAQPGATPERREAAMALAQATSGGVLIGQMVAGLRDNMVQALAGRSGLQRDQVATLVDELLMPEFRSRTPELIGAIAEIWALHFSLEELNELRAFYASPLGQRVLAAMPVIAQQSMQVGQLWGQRVAREALNKHRETLRSRGIQL